MILLTGGNGTLGKELRKLREYTAFGSDELDICDLEKVMDYVITASPDVIVHCAAFTDVARAEYEWKNCYQVNVAGTRNLVAAAQAVCANFVYMSTDYVFDGETGGYQTGDFPHPINWYATTKLLGEECAKNYKRHHIIRTSFKKSPWEHPCAVSDMWTSADYVDVIAPLVDKEIGKIIDGRKPWGISHVGTERKSMLELAQRRNPEIKAITRDEIKVQLPRDTSFSVVSK
jgi:dTDP-4-dehydrorhamnose reductase